MKKLMLSFCFAVFAQYAFAAPVGGDAPAGANVQKYVLTKLALMQADLAHLQAVVDMLAENDPSNAKAYQSIGGELLLTMQGAASGQGFTLSSLHAFGEANEQAIDAWLTKNRALASELESVAYEIEMLKAQHTNIITVSAARDTGDQQ